MNLPQPNTDRIISTFLDLVKIDSPSKQEADVAAYLKKALSELKVKVWMDDAGEKIGGNCGNLHVRMPARNSKAPAILFSAHMDTVMPGIGVNPTLKDGIVRTDGTTVLGADDKAGVTVIIELLRCLHESDIPHGPIEVVFDVAEEIGLLGCNQVDMNSIDAAFAIVLDGEDIDTIIYKSPSANRMVYTLEGIAAHAGMAPEKGISAIEVFAHAVSRMKLGRIDEETTANIGKVEAGTATNIVTPNLKANAECRSHSEEKLKAQTDAMAKAFEEAVKHYTKEIGGVVKRPVFHQQVEKEFTAMDVPFDSLPYTLAVESGKLNGMEMKPLSIGGGTNASVYNEKGLPSVILGCGMREEHTTSEHASIADIEMSTRLCLGIVVKNHEHAK
ncbi:M20/M25/M40 family metallo-hydrolase [bacterium]|nr:M20/M25/M40 family metallo-hydrolase [bacterium]